MATSKPGDDVAMWSGWRMFLFGAILVIGSVVGSLGVSMALYGFRYNVVLGAIIFESGLAISHIFCGGRLGRGYNPLHPRIRAQMPRLLALHLIVVTLIVAGGLLMIEFSPSLGSWWTTASGPKHDSPLSLIAMVLVVAIFMSEVSVARRWLQSAVSSQSGGDSSS